MTNKEKKLEIIKVIVTIVKDRHKQHITAEADYKAEKVKEIVWQNSGNSQWDNDYDMGFGSQRPNVTLYRTKYSDAKKEFEKWESIYYYALENLVGE